MGHSWFRVSDQVFLDNYQKLGSAPKVAKAIGCSHSTAAIRLKKLGVLKNKSDSQKKYTFNSHFFDADKFTQEAAFWLGWLASDGSNYIPNHCVSLAVATADEEVIIAFREALQATHRITRFEKPYNSFTNSISKITRLAITEKYFSEQLAKLGITGNKTLELVFPPIPKEFHGSFIAGFFEGDGSISMSSNYKALEFLGTKSILETIRGILLKECGITAKISRTSASDKCFTLRYYGVKTMSKIFEFIYAKHTPVLKRKYDKFLSYAH